MLNFTINIGTLYSLNSQCLKFSWVGPKLAFVSVIARGLVFMTTRAASGVWFIGGRVSSVRWGWVSWVVRCGGWVGCWVERVRGRAEGETQTSTSSASRVHFHRSVAKTGQDSRFKGVPYIHVSHECVCMSVDNILDQDSTNIKKYSW